MFTAFFVSVLFLQTPHIDPTASPAAASLSAHAIKPCAWSTDDDFYSCACVRRPTGSPVFESSIDLSSFVSCNAVSAAPFGMKLSPNGQYLYVAMAGGFFAENCQLVKISTATNEVVNVIDVGLYPEEIVFTTTPTGQMQYGFVSNSQDSTVTVFNANDQVVATIPVPCFGGNCDPGFTAYPFSLVVSPNQSRVYVGTLDGSGNIYAINANTLALMPSETLNIPDAHGRMAFSGSTLIVTGTEYEPDYSGSTAKVVFVNPQNPAGATTHIISSSNDFTIYPSTQDVSVHCNGLAFVSGFDLDADTFAYYVPTRSLVSTIPTLISGSNQGNAVSSRGLLAVGDFTPVTPQIALINAWTRQSIGTMDLSTIPGSHSGVNEIVFNASGTRMYVSMQYSDEVLVFRIP